MKKLTFLFLFLCLCLPLAAQQKRDNFEVALETSNYKYQEPHMEKPISLSGRKVGVSVMYLRRGVTSEFFDEEDPTFASLELRYMTGDVDYEGWACTPDGSICTPLNGNNIKDYYFEVALKTGRAFEISQTLALEPYLGVGWRNLRNHMEEMGTVGYLRESTYIYMPLGTKFVYHASDRFKLTLTGEFDWMLKGHQYSELYGGLNHYQTQGYGVRAGVRAEWGISETVGLFVEPFWRYWHIQNSDEAYFYNTGDGQWYVTCEPFNTTSEYGLRVGITF